MNTIEKFESFKKKKGFRSKDVIVDLQLYFHGNEKVHEENIYIFRPIKLDTWYFVGIKSKGLFKISDTHIGDSTFQALNIAIASIKYSLEVFCSRGNYKLSLSKDEEPVRVNKFVKTLMPQFGKYKSAQQGVAPEPVLYQKEIRINNRPGEL